MNQILTQTAPAIGANPWSFSFTAQQGGSTPPAQSLSISNVGSGTLTWTTASNAAWLSVSPASGSGNGSVTLTAATGSLTAGMYHAMISLSATGATSVSIPVTLEVTGTATSITLNPSSLTYSGIQGGSDPASQSVTVTSDGTWTASSNRTWLTVSPTSGSGNGTITASVNMSNAAVGTNTATLTVTSGSTTRTVGITFTVTAASLTLSPSSRTFTTTQGGANPADQSITVTSNGTWTASSNRPWLTVSPASGSNNGTLTASVNVSAANLGTNTATITVIGGGITRTATVTLTVNSSTSASSITLAWDANTESDLASYRIYRSTTQGIYGTQLATVQAGTVSYQATGLQVGSTYYFTVTAVDSAGNESPHSNEVSRVVN